MKTLSQPQKFPSNINKGHFKIHFNNKLNSFLLKRSIKKNSSAQKKLESYNFINNVIDNLTKTKVLNKINSFKIKTQAKLLKHNFTFTKMLICPSANLQNKETINTDNIVRRPRTSIKTLGKARKKILNIQQKLKNNKNPYYNNENKNFEITNFNHVKTESSKMEKNLNNSKNINFTTKSRNYLTYNFVKDTKNRYFFPTLTTNMNTENNLFKIKHVLLRNKNLKKKKKLDTRTSTNSANKNNLTSSKNVNNCSKDSKNSNGMNLLYNPENFLYQIYLNNNFPTKISPIYFSKLNIKEKFNYYKKDLEELENETNQEVVNLRRLLALNSRVNKASAKSSTCFFDLAFG